MLRAWQPPEEQTCFVRGHAVCALSALAGLLEPNPSFGVQLGLAPRLLVGALLRFTRGRLSSLRRLLDDRRWRRREVLHPVHLLPLDVASDLHLLCGWLAEPLALGTRHAANDSALSVAANSAVAGKHSNGLA
jgi:hypothetical protein